MASANPRDAGAHSAQRGRATVRKTRRTAPNELSRTQAQCHRRRRPWQRQPSHLPARALQTFHQVRGALPTSGKGKENCGWDLRNNIMCTSRQILTGVISTGLGADTRTFYMYAKYTQSSEHAQAYLSQVQGAQPLRGQRKIVFLSATIGTQARACNEITGATHKTTSLNDTRARPARTHCLAPGHPRGAGAHHAPRGRARVRRATRATPCEPSTRQC